MEDTLKHHIETVFTKWNFCQKSTSHQDQVSFCVNWYFRQIVAQLVNLQEVFHSEKNQDLMNKHSLRRYVEENVYSLSETMTENLDSCAALYHLETIHFTRSVIGLLNVLSSFVNTALRNKLTFMAFSPVRAKVLN